jgi:hypothetical protein
MNRSSVYLPKWLALMAKSVRAEANASAMNSAAEISVPSLGLFLLRLLTESSRRAFAAEGPWFERGKPRWHAILGRVCAPAASSWRELWLDGLKPLLELLEPRLVLVAGAMLAACRCPKSRNPSPQQG